MSKLKKLLAAAICCTALAGFSAASAETSRDLSLEDKGPEAPAAPVAYEWLDIVFHYSPVLSGEEADELNEPLECQGEVQCTGMWERASYYVASQADYEIQFLNDTLIQTYPADDNTRGLAWRIRKKCVGDSRYRILIQAACGENSPYCLSPPIPQLLEARRFIEGG